MASAAEKPLLRGFLRRKVKFHFVGMIATAVIVVTTAKFLYTDKRKQKHEEFYRLIFNLKTQQ